LLGGGTIKRFWVGFGALALVTSVNFWFYITFKPEDVLINRFFAIILGEAGAEYEPVNVISYVFYHAFGDALAVIMMMLFIALLMKLIKMEASIWYFRLILLMFLIFETLQIVMPGNFKWVDMAAYVLFYQIGLFMVEWVLEEELRVPFTRFLASVINRD
jgi:uncharacterized membrane protein